MSDTGRGTPGRRRGQPPRLFQGGLPQLKMSRTLRGILGTTWEVSIKKSQNQLRKRIPRLILLVAPGFFSPRIWYVKFPGVWRLSKKPEFIKGISTFRHL